MCLIKSGGGQRRQTVFHTACVSLWSISVLWPVCSVSSVSLFNLNSRWFLFFFLSVMHSVQFSCSVMSDSVTPWTAAHQASLSVTNSQSLLKLYVHQVGDAIQPAHPFSSPSSPAFNLSQHQGLFQWVSSSHQVAKVLEFQLQHQSFQWIFRTNFL